MQCCLDYVFIKIIKTLYRTYPQTFPYLLLATEAYIFQWFYNDLYYIQIGAGLQYIKKNLNQILPPPTSVDHDTGDITMQKGVPSNFGGQPYQFYVSVTDDYTVESTVRVTIKDLTDDAVHNSGAVRLKG